MHGFYNLYHNNSILFTIFGNKAVKSPSFKKKLLFIKSKRREFQTRFVNVVVDVVFVDGKILMFKGREFRVKDWVLIIAFKFC